MLKLWGFGMYCGAEHGCYLNRYEFTPRSVRNIDCWTARPFAEAPRAAVPLELPEAFRWVAAYEDFVLRTQGGAYRASAAQADPDTKLLPTTLAAEWRRLASDMETWMASASPHDATHKVHAPLASAARASLAIPALSAASHA